MGRWKPESTWEGGNQSHHGKVETTESLQEGRNHGVTMGGWNPESPWEGGNHRVTMGRWKPWSSHGVTMGRWKPVNMGRWKPESPWEDGNQSHHREGGNHRVRRVETMGREGGNHRVTMGRWKLWSHHRKVETTVSRGG